MKTCNKIFTHFSDVPVCWTANTVLFKVAELPPPLNCNAVRGEHDSNEYHWMKQWNSFERKERKIAFKLTFLCRNARINSRCVTVRHTESFPSSWLNYDFYKIKKTVYVHKYRWGFPDRIQGLLLSMLQLSRMRGIPSSSLTWGKQDDKELTSWNWSCCTTFISDSITVRKNTLKIHYLFHMGTNHSQRNQHTYSCSICSSSALKFLQTQVN